MHQLLLCVRSRQSSISHGIKKNIYFLFNYFQAFSLENTSRKELKIRQTLPKEILMYQRI